jgi:hypothetical protein
VHSCIANVTFELLCGRTFARRGLMLPAEPQ